MNAKVDRQKDGTIQLTITIPWKEIQKSYDSTVDELVKHVEIKGFRKGKAPRNLAEKQLNKDKVYKEVIKKIVPAAYVDTLKKHDIRSIIQPDIKLSKAKEGEDWEVIVLTCEKPKFSFGLPMME